MSVRGLQHGRDEGAIAVVYAIVFAVALVPLLAVSSTTLIRTTTAGELQRSADAGALAGASAIPFGDVNFARTFIDKTTGGATDSTLQDLGLSYTGADPRQVACDVAVPNATDPSGLGASARQINGQPITDALNCHASYLSDLSTLAALRDCAAGLSAPVGSLPSVPNLSPLLPALLEPGVMVTMSWRVTGPLDRLIDGSGARQSVTSVAHRRFKNMVVIPEVGITPGTTINLNPLARDIRNTALDALNQTEHLLAANPATAPCATALDSAHDDILDAIDPPQGGPDAHQVIDDAIAGSSPLLVARVVSTANGLGIPYLDFVPVCAERIGTGYIGHLGDFGACAIDAPGGFRASLRRP